MAQSKRLQTVRDPAVSLWQSALSEAIAHQQGQRGPQADRAQRLADTAAHPAMLATDALGQAYASGTPDEGVAQRGVAGSCASLYFDLAMALARGETDRVAVLKGEIQMSVCDPLWAEAIATYSKFLHSGKSQPYTRSHAPGDFVLSSLPDVATVALVADWGTGMASAQALLEQVARFKPDVVIHLGDIYYSCTPAEVKERFLDVYRATFPGPKAPPLFTLSGNHDRYSDGQGLSGLLAAIGQPSTYFCLRNNFWQFLAMDTGYHDADPWTVGSNLTYLEPDEVTWHRDKIANSGAGIAPGSGNASGRRGTVLLSHHPLFSFRGVGKDARGAPLAVNPHLLGAFGADLDKVSWWLWGHEHNLVIFDTYVKFPRGRCIGAGAIPMFVGGDEYTPVPGLVAGPGESGPPGFHRAAILPDNGTTYFHSYAMMTLDHARATLACYALDSINTTPGHVPPAGPPLFNESTTLPTGLPHPGP